jgi:hypothetical protein
MNTNRTLLRTAAALMLAGAFAANEANAAQPILPERPTNSQNIILAAADCYAVGESVATQNGGTLAKASADEQNGQSVCVIVVLVPGKDGQRPRRQEFVVPN